MHIHRTFWFHLFFWELCPFLNFKIWRKWKILMKQLVSATPLKPLNRIAWTILVMKDIMCRYAFLQEMLIWSFWGAIYIPFFVRLPVTNACQWNCHSFSSNVGAWGMWACSLFLSFQLYFSYPDTPQARVIRNGVKNCKKQLCDLGKSWCKNHNHIVLKWLLMYCLKCILKIDTYWY